jgi:hypothetical protein
MSCSTDLKPITVETTTGKKPKFIQNTPQLKSGSNRGGKDISQHTYTFKKSQGFKSQNSIYGQSNILNP